MSNRTKATKAKLKGNINKRENAKNYRWLYETIFLSEK